MGYTAEQNHETPLQDVIFVDAIPILQLRKTCDSISDKGSLLLQPVSMFCAALTTRHRYSERRLIQREQAEKFNPQPLFQNKMMLQEELICGILLGGTLTRQRHVEPMLHKYIKT